MSEDRLTTTQMQWHVTSVGNRIYDKLLREREIDAIHAGTKIGVRSDTHLRGFPRGLVSISQEDANDVLTLLTCLSHFLESYPDTIFGQPFVAELRGSVKSQSELVHGPGEPQSEHSKPQGQPGPESDGNSRSGSHSHDSGGSLGAPYGKTA